MKQSLSLDMTNEFSITFEHGNGKETILARYHLCDSRG